MKELTSENLPAAFMEGGFKVSPRYTINGEPKRIKGWQIRSALNEHELGLLVQEALQTVEYFKGKGIATETDSICDFIVVPPKGRFIIDIDNKGGKNGDLSWESLLDTYNIHIEPVVSVKSKSGGYHHYFTSDVDYIKTLANLAGYTGVDIRGQRGHVVMPTHVGSLDNWQPGQYLLYKGDPRHPFEKPFPISKISKAYSSNDEELWASDIKDKISKREKIEFIPNGMRDNLLWDAACILYRKGITRAEADKYMADLVSVCEISDDMTVDKIQKTANEKLARVYKNDRHILTVMDLERELALGGVVQIVNEGATKYFFEYNNIFNLDPMSLYGKEAICDILKKYRIVVDDGNKSKIIGGDSVFKRYVPEQSVYGLGLFPDANVHTFRDEHGGQTLYNTYLPAFKPEEINDLTKDAEDYYPLFIEFLQYLHPSKWEELLNRIAWTIQFPQLKAASLSVYVSKTQGIGKDVLCDLHGNMLGPRHYRRLNSLEELTSRFTDLSDVLLLNIAEVQMGRGLAARNRATEVRGLLKTLITSSIIKSERKNVQATWRTNYTNFVMTTNEFNSNLLESEDRRHEIFIFPSTHKLDQKKFGRLADLSNVRNYPAGLYPWDKLGTIWKGLKSHNISKKYHIESANLDADKMSIHTEGLSHIQAWLLTELPDVFSKDFVTWFIYMFYPQKDRVRPIDETEYFFKECKHYLQNVQNSRGSHVQRLSLTQLRRITSVGERMLDLQKRKVPKGTSSYYQYLYTVRNHGDYDDHPTDVYYAIEDRLIEYYKSTVNTLDTNTEELDKILLKYRLKVA